MKLSDKTRNRGYGIRQLELRYLYITANDNILASFEQRYIHVVTDRDAKGKVTGRTYYYNSLVMLNVKYDKTGKSLHQTFVPKSLVNTNGWFGLGHYVAPVGEQHALIFNDNRKNTERKLETHDDMKTATPGSSRCVARLVTVDDQGKRKINTLFSNKEEDFVLLPESSIRYGHRTILTAAADGKLFKLLKIQY